MLQMYPASHSYFISIDKPTDVLKHFLEILRVNSVYDISNQFWLVLTLWHLAAFGDFRKKTPKRTWLCMGISPVW